MKKPLVALVLALLTLPLGCKVEKDETDPLATRTGFCDAWATDACQAKVVENCNANSATDCKATQSDFCLGIIPETYVSTHAAACLAKVKAAYADASLTSDELAVVLRLADPCDKLSKGNAAVGDSCEKNDDCNTAGGVTCVIKLGGNSGTCAKPEVVKGGDPCDHSDQVCDDGLYCDGDNCLAYKKTGRACNGDYECVPEDHCVVAEGASASSCQPRLALNDTCTTDDECASGYCAMLPDDKMGECASTIVLSRLEPLCLNLR